MGRKQRLARDSNWEGWGVLSKRVGGRLARRIYEEMNHRGIALAAHGCELEWGGFSGMVTSPGCW
ncbi:MAG: hypothetical protein ABIJ44_09190 [Pseudomonadota bacterium]